MTSEIVKKVLTTEKGTRMSVENRYPLPLCRSPDRFPAQIEGAHSPIDVRVPPPWRRHGIDPSAAVDEPAGCAASVVPSAS